MYHEAGPYHVETFTSKRWLRQRHWWRIVASNGRILATSEMYVNRGDRDEVARRLAEACEWVVLEK